MREWECAGREVGQEGSDPGFSEPCEPIHGLGHGKYPLGEWYEFGVDATGAVFEECVEFVRDRAARAQFAGVKATLMLATAAQELGLDPCAVAT